MGTPVDEGYIDYGGPVTFTATTSGSCTSPEYEWVIDEVEYAVTGSPTWSYTFWSLLCYSGGSEEGYSVFGVAGVADPITWAPYGVGVIVLNSGTGAEEANSNVATISAPAVNDPYGYAHACADWDAYNGGNTAGDCGAEGGTYCPG
jgi:hypothetical protein